METRHLILDTAQRMFSDHCDKPLLDSAEQGVFPTALLTLIRENGFQQLAMHTSGVALADALAVLKPAGQHALPLPLAEMLLGNRWRSELNNKARKELEALVGCYPTANQASAWKSALKSLRQEMVELGD